VLDHFILGVEAIRVRDAVNLEDSITGVSKLLVIGQAGVAECFSGKDFEKLDVSEVVMCDVVINVEAEHAVGWDPARISLLALSVVEVESIVGSTKMATPAGDATIDAEV